MFLPLHGGEKYLGTVARIFRELLWRDHEDGRATESTIGECGFRNAD
jgi:hypothetical protein